MKRNYELDFLKFIFTIAIIVYHSHNLICPDTNLELLPKGYLGVEFFFMTSGYLMMAGIMRDKEKGIEQANWSFIGKKVKAFLPPVIFAFLVNFFVWTICCKKYSFKNLLIEFLYTPPEWLLLRHTDVRFPSHNYNGPAWYIAAMLFGMFLLYPVAKRYKEKFGTYIAPALSLGLYGWITNYCGSDGISVIKQWINGINGGLARALAGLCLGSFIYFVTEKIKANPRQLNKAGNITFGVIEGIIFFALYLFMRNNATAKYGRANDSIAILYIFLLLVITISKNYDLNKFFASKPMLFLYKLSLPLFLNQWVVVRFSREMFAKINFVPQFFIYVGITVALALISIPATKGLERLWHFLIEKLTKTKEA